MDYVLTQDPQERERMIRAARERIAETEKLLALLESSRGSGE